MGRQVRKVPANWQHPKTDRGNYIPLFEGDRLPIAVKYVVDAYNESGLEAAIEELPDKNDFMPRWNESDKTHYQMYETTSEGTPISPVMDNPEALARWLADNKASIFGSMTATYAEWLAICKGEPTHGFTITF